MDFNETYHLLRMRESLTGQNNDKVKSNHDARNKQIQRQHLAQEEAERVRFELEKNADKAKQEKKKKLKFQSVLNALSTK